jgi:hypothetical protein
MNKGEYLYTFCEALEKLKNEEGFIRGKNFRKGYYLDFENEILTLKYNDGLGTFNSENALITKNMIEQKYKISPVANRESLEL